MTIPDNPGIPKLMVATLLVVMASSSQANFWLEKQWPETDFDKKQINMNEITQGGPPRDGIPSIDQPEFVSIEQAARWIETDEPVIVVQMNNSARAYPLQILTYHEIVNDLFEDQPIAVTFCPLCNAAIVFDRQLGDTVLEFGTTGLLRKSDLVMYDRQTFTWWQQFSGNAIVGQMLGQTLHSLPADIVGFGSFARNFPDGRVLSRNTGYSRPYGRNPYQGYDRIGQRPFLFRDSVDPRLPAMERVLNVSIGDTHRIYPFGVLASHPVINDRVAGLPVVVFATEQVRSALDESAIATSRRILSASAYLSTLDGINLEFELKDGELRDTTTGSVWNRFGLAISGDYAGRRLQHTGGGSHFAFAWLAFNPDSGIYKSD